MFMELYREEKREEGDRGGQEDKRGESKGERQIQPVISSLSVLHTPGRGRGQTNAPAAGCQEIQRQKYMKIPRQTPRRQEEMHTHTHTHAHTHT